MQKETATVDKKSPIPLYVQLEKALREKAEILGENSPLGTIDELCKFYRVSAITVKRTLKTLNDSGIVKSIKSKGNFVIKRPDPMPPEKSYVFCSDIRPNAVLNPLYSKIYEGAESIFSEKGFRTDFYTASSLFDEEFRNRKNVHGVILAGVRNFKLYESLVGLNMKFVLADVSSQLFPSVLTDNRYGGELATRHLIELGHRRIAIFNGNQEDETFKARFDGYKDAIQKAKIQLNNNYVIDIFRKTREDKRESIKKLLATKNAPTALFITADNWACLYLDVLKEMGMKIPEDISVIGYDGLTKTVYASPPLSTIEQPMFEIGRMTAELSLKNEEEVRENIKPLFIKPRLIERQSCKPV